MTLSARRLTLAATVLRDLPRALELEWLETNGIGGFASSTVAGVQTRRYHGLLIAALAPPVERQSMLTSLDVAVIQGGRDHFLSCHLYPDTVFPRGHETLERFELAPFPRWTHGLETGLRLTHELWMEPGQNTTVLVWRLAAGAPAVELSIAPLTGLRDFHALSHRAAAAPGFLEIGERRVSIHPHAAPGAALHLSHSGARVEPADRWYREFQLPQEAIRETDWAEDLWNPCQMTFTLTPDAPAVLVASTEPIDLSDAAAWAEGSLRRRLDIERPVQIVGARDPAVAELAPAVRDFRVRRGDGQPTVIAGYHWFADWGRDTMIALPGLFLVHGHTREAMATLRTWMGFLSQGMLPNRFPDHGEPPDYNTVDAALWLAVAVLRTWQCLGGRGARGLVPRRDLWQAPMVPGMNELSGAEANFLHEALGALTQIIRGYQEGTRHGIRVDTDGLVTQGETGMQLTWMDAKCEDVVFTPRQGKPIEIQALWLNTLLIAALLRRVHGDLAAAKELEAEAQRVARAVEHAFWPAGGDGLADVVGPGGRPDFAVRPNQIFALSLPYPLVPPERAAAVLAAVERDLLTPYGLRSLAPGHPSYTGVYEGPRPVRDAAYHQGTVWSWLIGPFVDATLRVRGATPETAEALRQALDPLVDHVRGQAGLGSVSEIFDGDAPHTPRGCIAQAWSVAELLRALWTLSHLGGD